MCPTEQFEFETPGLGNYFCLNAVYGSCRLKIANDFFRLKTIFVFTSFISRCACIFNTAGLLHLTAYTSLLSVETCYMSGLLIFLHARAT